MSAALDLLGDQHDAGASVATAFLREVTAAWRPYWRVNVCGIWPNGERGVVGRSWRVAELPEREAEIVDTIAAWNRTGAGCYFSPDPLRREVSTKAKASDVAAVVMLAADIDPDLSAAGSFDAARTALWGALGAPEMGGIALRWIIDTGHGAGLFAPLAELMDTAAGVAARAAWQARLRAEVPGVAVDTTADAGRLMRLPGPYNWPKASKVAKGYPAAGTPTALRARRPDVAAVPAALVAALGAGAPSMAARQTVPRAELLAPSPELLAEAIAHLPPAKSREEWITNLHALKGAGASEEQALAYSNTWDGPPEDPEDFERVWAGIDPSAAGWPHLERRARAAGWHGGIEHEFRDVVAQMRAEAEAAARAGRFGNLHVRTVADAERAAPRDYLAKPLLARGELSVWWGAPKVGKSFLAGFVAWCIAQGNDFAGFKVKRRRRVLYIAAEGEGGFNGRVQALRREHGDPGDFFRFIAQPVSIGPPGGDLSDLIAAAREMRADLIVVDTLARTFGAGDENTAQDMGRFVANLDRLRDETGAHVLVIHHGRKDGGDLRGSGALAGAADLIVRVDKGTGADPGVATIEAAKDDADGRSFGFRLHRVSLGADDDGDPRWTCVAQPAEAPASQPTKLPKAAAAVLAILAELVAAEGAAPTGVATGGARAIRDARLREECDSRRVSAAEKATDRARSVRQALADLRDAGRLDMRDGWVWLSASAAGGGRPSLEGAN